MCQGGRCFLQNKGKRGSQRGHGVASFVLFMPGPEAQSLPRQRLPDVGQGGGPRWDTGAVHVSGYSAQFLSTADIGARRRMQPSGEDRS